MTSPGILMVTGAYWPELSGGGLQCRTMIHALKDRFRFRVFTTCTDRALAGNEIVEGVPVTRTYIDVKRPQTKLGAAWATIVFFLRHQGTFDVVHLHGFSQKSVLLVLLSRLFAKKVVITIHTAGQDEPEAVQRQGWLAFKCYSSADRFIAISPALAENYHRSQLPDERLVLAPNAVDTVRFAPVSSTRRRELRQQLGLTPVDLPCVLFVGFFSTEKRPELLFNAWLQTHDAGSQSILVFVGATQSAYHEVDAAIADRIRRQARERGLDALVHLVGEVSDVERYYQASDVFVMPSVREAFGMALVEAMACGLPPIATRIAGVTDTIVGESTTGILAPPDDSVALASALRRLLTDPQHAVSIGAAARERVEQRFGLAPSVDRWTTMYRSVLGG